MKKQKGTKREKLYLGIFIFCLLGTFMGIITLNPFTILTYAALTILFFYLRKRKLATDQNKASVIATTKTQSISTSNSGKSYLKTESTDTDININTPPVSCNIERFHVAGTSYHQEEIKSLGTENLDFELSKKELIDEGFEDKKIYAVNFLPSNVELIEEPENPYDSNAVKIVIDDVLVGHIKKGSCSHVKKLLHSGKIKKIEANIYGGKYKVLHSEYDDAKGKDVYHLEQDESNYYVIVEITTEN